MIDPKEEAVIVIRQTPASKMTRPQCPLVQHFSLCYQDPIILRVQKQLSRRRRPIKSPRSSRSP